MPTKAELAKRIIDALVEEQRNPTPFAKKMVDRAPLALPPQLSVGNGRFLPATAKALEYVADYAAILKANDPLLALSYSDDEISDIAGQAFGVAFSSVDLDHSNDEIHTTALSALADALSTELAPNEREEEVVFGCWALTGPGTDDMQIGPVRIEARSNWLTREEGIGRVSPVTARRIRRAWSGDQCRRRTPSFDEAKERAVLDTIDECQTVCSVATKGLSQKVAEQKAPLVSRLAFTALALSWKTPSTALDRMGLRIDGPIHKVHTVSFAPTHMSRLSTSLSHIGGQFVTDEWLTLWPSLDWLVGPIGDALSAYVKPRQSPARRKIDSALFMSLWWFHEACRERAPLLAIVKFAASLDALAGGGESRGIRELIDARLSITPGTPLTNDGRMTAEVVKEIYGDARSRAIHGSTDRHGHDWQKVRHVAETLARLCLNRSCGWIWDNPNSDDLMALRRPAPN